MITVLNLSRSIAKIYALVYGVALILGMIIGLSFSNLKNSTVFGLGVLLLPYLPLLWLKLKESGTLPKWLSVSYLLFLLPVTLVVLFIGFSSIRDFKIGNGLRKVYEGPIEDGKFMAAFRTPDEGALGGDYLVAYVVKKVGCGVELRKYVGRISYRNNEFSEVEYQGKTYFLPSMDVLWEQGKLNHDKL